MLRNSIKIKERYDRYARFYDWFEYLPEKFLFAKYRELIIPALRGNILEIGVGTGKNLPYYSGQTEVVAIDFSKKMLKRAEARLRKLDKTNIELKLADAEELPFSDNSFDIVISTFTFCSVPDPVQGFKEVNRVLRPGGQAVFFEHVRSGGGSRGRLQDILNPLMVGLFGFNINRKTGENIRLSGLRVVSDKRLAMGDVLRLFTCTKY